MSETPTGTDRVELTEAEREALGVLINRHDAEDRSLSEWQFCEGCDKNKPCPCSGRPWAGDELTAAVESIVAARVQALTAERDELRGIERQCGEEHGPLLRENKTLTDELAAARAELAAANTTILTIERAQAKVEDRAAALQARVDDYENGISWGTSCISCAKTLDSSYAEYVRAETLQATLDRVTALADEMENPNTEHGTMPGVRMQVRREWAARLRALASSPKAGQ